MYEAGKKVVKEKYGLTEQQMKVIEVLQEEPASFFEIRDGKLLFQVWLNLIQNPFTTEWTDKDGTYEVIFDAETGEIRDVIYDSGLNGNG